MLDRPFVAISTVTDGSPPMGRAGGYASRGLILKLARRPRASRSVLTRVEGRVLSLSSSSDDPPGFAR